MKSFAYESATSIDEVIPLLADHADGVARPLAGGTDLLTLMKADITVPARLIDIKRLEGLPRGVEETADGITIGALTTLTDIETNALLHERCPALVEAAAVAATPQLRNMATLGGNLLQRPRCWYFRNPRVQCWLKGGTECQARDGENQQHALYGDSPCVAVHPSDLAPALAALGAQVRLRGADGERVLPLEAFFALPTEERRTETVLGDDELILSVHIPTNERMSSTYVKAMDRKVWAFALVSVAAAARVANGRIEDVRLVLGGVANTPWRLHAAEQHLIGAQVSADVITHVAAIALSDAQPLQHNHYKVPLAKALIHRALEAILEQGDTPV